MSINKKIIDKYKLAYKNLIDVKPGISFDETSPYYREEIWKWVDPILVPGVLEYTYKVSNHGRVYSMFREKKYKDGLMSPSLNQHGYRQVNLRSVDGKNICVKISRLIMLHFNFRSDCYLLEVDHIDGNKENNCIWNLEWVTPQENTHRAINNGLRTLSCNSNSETLLTNDQAYQLYDEAISGKYSYEYLSNKYNVSESYISKLVEGVIRPYIANKYYKNHNHY